MKLEKGDKVGHPRRPDWGRGEVLQVLPAGRYSILFSAVGIKTIATKHVELVKIDGKDSFSDSTAVLQRFRMKKLGHSRISGFREEYVHSYMPAVRRMFRRGELIREWMDRFPGIFDADDETFAIGPAGSSAQVFRTWLGAILVSRQFRCSCLLEGWTLSGHREKQKKLRQALPILKHQALFDLAKGHSPKEFPALFCWSEVGTKPFFAHVRDGSDEPSNEWIKQLSVLKEKTGLDAVLVTLQPDKGI